MSQRLRSPQVMLLIDTSSVYGRELIRGDRSPMPRSTGHGRSTTRTGGLLDPLPPLLKGWKGDGIMARSVRKADLKRLLATGLPRWSSCLPTLP